MSHLNGSVGELLQLNRKGGVYAVQNNYRGSRVREQLVRGEPERIVRKSTSV